MTDPVARGQEKREGREEGRKEGSMVGSAAVVVGMEESDSACQLLILGQKSGDTYSFTLIEEVSRF